MIFPFYIARRYLFSKKSHNAINIISGISVGGVALAAMAMVCVMSVFNGFRDLVASLFTSFDPQIKVVPAIGKRRLPTIPSCSASSNGLESKRHRPVLKTMPWPSMATGKS